MLVMIKKDKNVPTVGMRRKLYEMLKSNLEVLFRHICFVYLRCLLLIFSDSIINKLMRVVYGLDIPYDCYYFISCTNERNY